MREEHRNTIDTLEKISILEKISKLFCEDWLELYRESGASVNKGKTSSVLYQASFKLDDSRLRAVIKDSAKALFVKWQESGYPYPFRDISQGALSIVAACMAVPETFLFRFQYHFGDSITIDFLATAFSEKETE